MAGRAGQQAEVRGEVVAPAATRAESRRETRWECRDSSEAGALPSSVNEGGEVMRAARMGSEMRGWAVMAKTRRV